MGYTLQVGQALPVVKAPGGEPVLVGGSTTITITPDGIVQSSGDFATSAMSLHGLAVGTAAVTINGVEHDVTVVTPPFDWMLGG